MSEPSEPLPLGALPSRKSKNDAGSRRSSVDVALPRAGTVASGSGAFDGKVAGKAEVGGKVNGRGVAESLSASSFAKQAKRAAKGKVSAGSGSN